MHGIRRVRIDPLEAKPAHNPIFVGNVVTQEIVNETHAELLRVTAVAFEVGARNRPHRHSTDQVLVVTAGQGFIATDDETLSLESGDVAFVAKGTRHWHGASPGASFAHLSILTPGHMEIDDSPTV